MIADHHTEYLEAHAVDVELAEKLGVRSIMTAADLPPGFAHPGLTTVPSLLFPWRNTRGDECPQLRIDETSSYLFHKGATLVIWPVHLPPDPDGAALVEGPKQALAVASTGINWSVYAMAGCSGWRKDGLPLPDLDDLTPGLDLVAILDADVASNPAVYREAAALLAELPLLTGATSVRLAKPPGTAKTGIDDLLGSRDPGHRLPLLERILGAATTKLGRKPPEKKKRDGSPYFFDDRFLPMTAALAIDAEAEFAIHQAADAIYRYHHPTGVFRRIGKFGPVLADLIGDFHEGKHTTGARDCAVVVALEAGRTFDHRPASPLVPLANGVLDPRTEELLPHSPDRMLLGSWAVAWDPEATCPRILAYLERHFTGQVDAILNTFARALNRTDPQDRALFLFGLPRCGKSTVVRLMEALVGSDGCSAESLQGLASDRWSVAQLYGKALNAHADLSSDDVRNTSLFKSVTGGDRVSGEFKYEQKFTFTSHALLVFSANNVPALPSESGAERARFVPVFGGRSFVGHEDPAVEAELMEELPGLMVELVRRFQAGLKPTPLPVVVDEFRRSTDRVARFVEEYLDKLAPSEPLSAGAEASMVYERFRDWADKNSYAGLGRNKFYDRVRSAGFMVGHSGGNRVGAKIRAQPVEAVGFRAWVRDTFGDDPPEGGGNDSPPDGGDVPSTRARAREGGVSLDGLDGSVTTNAYRESEKERGGGGGNETDLEGEGRAKPSKPSKRPRPARARVRTKLAVDFETPDAKLLYAGGYSGPFCRLFAWDDGDGFAGVTADPDQMRRILTEAPRLVWCNGWQLDVPAAALHLGLDLEELMSKSDDLMIGWRLAHPPRATEGRDRDRYDLGTVAERRLGTGKLPTLAALKRRYGGYDKIPTDDPEYRAYAARDVALTHRLAQETELLPADPAYYERECRVATIAARLSLVGLRVDVEEAEARHATHLVDHADRIARLVDLGLPATNKRGQPVAAPLATLEGLAVLETLAGPDWPRTDKTGRLKLDKKTLAKRDATGRLAEILAVQREIADEHDFAGDILTWGRDGRIYPTYHIDAANGRWSTARPNVQGVGKRDPHHLTDRELVLAEPGEVFVQCDLASIDNRAVSGLSGDTGYAELLAPGRDVHNEVGRLWYPDATDAELEARRTEIKAISHGANYGSGAKSVARDEGLELAAVRQAFSDYFARFPVIREWQDRIRALTDDGRGAVDNGFGRLIRCKPGEAYTQAPARQAAACARDLALTGIFRLADAGLLPHLQAFVHDEIILSAPEDQADDVLARAVEAMSFDWRSPSGLVLPIIAKPSPYRGPRWADVYH